MFDNIGEDEDDVFEKNLANIFKKSFKNTYDRIYKKHVYR